MRSFACCVIAALALFAGCSKSTKGQVPAKGTVTYADGAPLADVTVVFTAEKVSATAVTKGDGSFELGTETPGDGAPVGNYKVTVQPGNSPSGGPNAAIGSVYQDLNTTPLSFEIKGDGDNNFDIKIDKSAKTAAH